MPSPNVAPATGTTTSSSRRQHVALAQHDVGDATVGRVDEELVDVAHLVAVR